jgi:hypothetical protein
MKRFLAVLACVLALSAHAYAQKTKGALTTEVNTNWPDNTTGAITPALLRATVLDIINSYLDLNGTLSFACATSNWFQSAVLTTFTCTQPNFSDILGTVAGTQTRAAAYLAYESGWVANFASVNHFARFSRVVATTTIDNLMGASVGFSCQSTQLPIISLVDCATSNVCAPAVVVTLANVTVTTLGQVAQGTVLNPIVTAGDFIAWIVGGNCTNSEFNATAQIHQN